MTATNLDEINSANRKHFAQHTENASKIQKTQIEMKEERESIAREKRNARRRKYCRENKEKVKYQTDLYRLVNKDKLAAKAKVYRTKNKEKIKAYRENNKEKFSEYQKEYVA